MLTLNLNILWTVVNILVLFVLLRKFLYRPVMNVIEQRQKQIDDAIADAEGKRTTHRLFWHRRRINCRMWIPKLPSAAKPTKTG